MRICWPSFRPEGTPTNCRGPRAPAIAGFPRDGPIRRAESAHWRVLCDHGHSSRPLQLHGLDRCVIKPLFSSNSDLYTEFDRYASRGLDILNRVVAVRATDDSARQPLLNRIRALFDNPR
jgi:hypothetical protein